MDELRAGREEDRARIRAILDQNLMVVRERMKEAGEYQAHLELMGTLLNGGAGDTQQEAQERFTTQMLMFAELVMAEVKREPADASG